MKKLLSLFIITSLFSGELEVDGNLKVSGNIDAQNQAIKNVGVPQELTDAINGNVLQDALRDDAVYIIKYYSVFFTSAFNTSFAFDIFYKEVGETQYTNGWESYLNNLLSEGWIISRVMIGKNNDQSHLNAMYELKKPVQE